MPSHSVPQPWLPQQWPHWRLLSWTKAGVNHQWHARGWLTCRKHKEWCTFSSGELFMRSREGYFGVCFPSCAVTREMNTKITLNWVQKNISSQDYVHYLFLTWHDEFINDDKIDDLHTSSPCLTRSVYDRLMTSHRLLRTSHWSHNCDAITWNVISSSLNIDFIHGDFHDWSWMEIYFRMCALASYHGFPASWTRGNVAQYILPTNHAKFVFCCVVWYRSI